MSHQLILPGHGDPPREVFLVLPGLNLHPDRLAPWRELLLRHGLGLMVPALTGFAAPGDPAQGRVRAQHWLDDVDAAWRQVRRELPGARPSLFGFSLGGLLGLSWSKRAGIPLKRALLLAPALRIRRRHRALIRTMGLLLPDWLGLPSLADRHYRFHPWTTVAAYRAVAALERGLRPTVRQWLGGRPAGMPPLLVAFAAGDELIDAEVLFRLGLLFPGRVKSHLLDHQPRRGDPVHLGMDATTLGRRNWSRLVTAVEGWLAETDAGRPPAGSRRAG